MALLALWNPNIQFLKTDGTINAGGKIIVTDHNDAESIPANYSDADGTTLNSSPIVLDALGRATCYIDDGSTYDLYVKDANGATLWTVPEMTPGTETIVVRDGFSVSSNDRSVAVTISVDSDGVTKYDLSIKKEIDRAKEAEKGLADAIEAEKNRAEEAERTISESISKETERAIAAEKASRTEIVAGDNITVEKTVGADGQDVYTVSGESKDNLVDDVRVNGASVVTDKVANIDVPVAGTASPLMDGKASVGNSLKYAREDHVHQTDTSREDIANKTTVVLGTSDSKYPTDKAVAKFVNSSIATNTANYISNNGEPFTSVEQLEAYSGPVTNNDYAFVTGTDSEGNTYYDRYKATVSGSTVTWALEYRLNNSSFTAAQWSAINSGITSALVAKIHDHSNKDVLDGITSDKVNSWDGKEDAFEVLSTTKGGTGTNAASKSALTSSLINSLSTESSKPVDADYYVSQYQNGGTSNTSFVRRPVSALWEYIKDKISSVLRLTASDYAGKAATAGTADKAVADNSGNNIEETYTTKTELSTHTSDTTVHITEAERKAWNAKQSALDFDTTPTAGSTNPVTSDGIKTALNNYVGIYKVDSSNFHVKNNEYYSFICRTNISNWEKIQADFFCPTSDSSTVGKFNIFATLSTADTSLHTPERVAEFGGIVWDYNYKGYNTIKYRIYVAKSGDNFYFYAKRNSSNDKSLTAFRSCLLYTTNTSLTDNVSADLDDATWQTLSLVEMKNVYSSTTQERLDSHKNDTTVHITAEERKAWNAKQSALDFDTTPTAGSTNPVTSGGIKTAIDSVDAKGIVINEINGENVICFE